MLSLPVMVKNPPVPTSTLFKLIVKAEVDISE